MKRLYVLLMVLSASLWFAMPSLAAPAYGTRLPDKLRLAAGGQTYVVDERNLEGDFGEINSIQHFLLLSFGLTDWLSIDLKGGAGDAEYDSSDGNKIQYPAFVGGGYGFRVKFYDDNDFKAVFGFQHISIHPYSVFIGVPKNKSVIDDWQFSLLGSYDCKFFTPYVGGKWSRMDYIHWVDDVRKRKKSDLGNSAGAIVGVDIPFGKKVWVNAEGQFVDVKAFSVSLNYQF